MKIHDEKYEKRFIVIQRRPEDGRWFIMRYAHQYYVKAVSQLETMNSKHDIITSWIVMPGQIFDEEELAIRKLRGDKLYIREE